MTNKELLINRINLLSEEEISALLDTVCGDVSEQKNISTDTIYHFQMYVFDQKNQFPVISSFIFSFIK